MSRGGTGQPIKQNEQKPIEKTGFQSCNGKAGKESRIIGTGHPPSPSNSLAYGGQSQNGNKGQGQSGAEAHCFPWHLICGGSHSLKQSGQVRPFLASPKKLSATLSATMSRQCKTKARKGHSRPLGDKGRYMVTRGKTKGDFVSGFVSMKLFLKKSFDNLFKPITFHFIQAQPIA